MRLHKVCVKAICVSLLMLGTTIEAKADWSNDDVLTIRAPDSVSARSGCTELSIKYTIDSAFRNTPGWVRLSLVSSNDGTQYDESFAYDYFDYNIDWNSGRWKVNGTKPFGDVNLTFCTKAGKSRTGADLRALTESGRYYITAKSVFIVNYRLPENQGGAVKRTLTIPIDIRVAKTITCVKGKSKKLVTGFAPKCPKGFKQLNPIEQTSKYRYNSLDEDPVCFDVLMDGPTGGAKVSLSSSPIHSAQIPFPIVKYKFALTKNGWCNPKMIKQLQDEGKGYSFFGFPTNRWIINWVVTMYSSDEEVCYAMNGGGPYVESAERSEFSISVKLIKPGICWLETFPDDDEETPLMLNGARKAWAIEVVP